MRRGRQPAARRKRGPLGAAPSPGGAQAGSPLEESLYRGQAMGASRILANSDTCGGIRFAYPPPHPQSVPPTWIAPRAIVGCKRYMVTKTNSSKVLSKVLKERGETMTVVDLKNGYERTINRCDSCGLVIAANGTDTGAIVGPWFGKVVCDDCLRAGIVYCSHCGKPHHKETPHKVVCAGCERVFTARIDYDGELCPLCIQAENGGVRINIYGALERY